MLGIPNLDTLKRDANHMPGTARCMEVSWRFEEIYLFYIYPPQFQLSIIMTISP